MNSRTPRRPSRDGWIDPAAVTAGARQVQRSAYQLGVDDASNGARRGHEVPAHFRPYYCLGFASILPDALPMMEATDDAAPI